MSLPSRIEKLSHHSRRPCEAVAPCGSAPICGDQERSTSRVNEMSDRSQLRSASVSSSSGKRIDSLAAYVNAMSSMDALHPGGANQIWFRGQAAAGRQM